MTRPKPFLRWPGGKRWLAPKLAEVLRGLKFERYVEPFLGGGALFFEILPERAMLSDINRDLIVTYDVIKEDCMSLQTRLRGMKVSRSSYEEIRLLRSTDPLERAARFLYLNRTSFSGIYRVNKEGIYNVPYAGGSRTPALLWERGLLSAAAVALARAELAVRDFEEALDETGCGDVVYCDPTYVVRHNNNGFVRYNERNFAWEDQRRLAAACISAARRGAKVIVSNANHREVAGLYKGFEPSVVHRFSRLSPRPSDRGSVDELVLFSWPPYHSV